MKLFSSFFVITCCLHFLDGGYVVTTPRRWTSGVSSQVCVTLSSGATASGTLTVAVTNDREKQEKQLVNQILPLIEGESSICDDVFLPKTSEVRGDITITGHLQGTTLNESRPITIHTDQTKTYIQTDKSLYKPSQTVQFRILTVSGPFLSVSTSQYDEIWIENPSATRIAQWLNVTNDQGLIHMSFTLSDEPEQGEYKIKIRSPQKTESQTFKVEEYVLPRYEVTIKPPNYVLGTSEIITFSVCAKYTYGQPVKGNVTLTVNNNSWGAYKVDVVKEGKISGCKEFKLNATDLSINGNSYFAYALKANAVVMEEGTGVELKADEVTVDISRTALTFEDIGSQKFVKPEIPYVGEVKISLPDESPAANEPMEVCCGHKTCKNLTTNANGILKFAVPPHLEDAVTVKALNYQAKRSTNSYRSIMYASTFHKNVKKYHSPSNSSLVIALVDDELKCSVTETIDFELPVRFAASKQDSAAVAVQVVSRGQIQFSKTFEQTLTPGSFLHIPDNIFVEPLKEPVTKGLIRGQFSVPISLPKTVSPEAQVIIWYAREDGEVVSDARQLDITECLLYSVELNWSTAEAQPGDTARLSLKSEPSSLCSLGVVDKSVHLLSSKKNSLTLKSLLNLAEKSSVGAYENKQVDDYNYCRKKEEEKPSTELPPILPPVDLPLDGRKKRSFFPYPGSFYSDDIDALHMFDEAGIYVISDLTLETRPCRRRYGHCRLTHGHLMEGKPPPECDRCYIRVMVEHILISCPTYNHLRLRYFGNQPTLSSVLKDDPRTLPTVCCRKAQNQLASMFAKARVFCRMRPQGRRFPIPASVSVYYGSYSMTTVPFFTTTTPYRTSTTVLPLTFKTQSPSPSLIIDKPTPESGTSVRDYFPETFLWQLFNLDTGLNEEDLTLPDTVTEWVGSAVCVHPTKGVGISASSSITTFKDFFIDLTLPPTAKRGEIFPVKISVFNYLESPLPLKLVLSESPQYDILMDEGEALGTGERSSCLPAQDKVVHSIRIKPTDIGTVNITVSASVDANSIETCGHVTGKLRTDVLIKGIEVEVEGVMEEKIWSDYVCSQDLESDADALKEQLINPPPTIIPDSARGFVAVVGDLMGPTLENLGGLVRMPYGCGEQNMLNFAPNIFVMQYLDASNQNNEETASKAIQFMEKGYQRELNYRHSDGSFSAFGSRDDSGSTWLTAFVLKSFAQARQYISIDADDLTMSQNWLKQRQLENGCFESVGRVLHKGMKGGLQGSESPVLLSSFVLIALIEAGESKESSVIREALYCLEADGPTRNPYQLAVRAYALGLAGSPNATDTIESLISLSTVEGATLSWDLPKDYQGGKGIGVETAGYAVLALLAQGSDSPQTTERVRKIIKWMNTQRNGNGGFVSTQDTIVALQALAHFEKTTYQGPLDMSVILEMTDSESVFTVNEQNKLLQQRTDFAVIPTTVNFIISGTGCVLLQTVLRYNVPDVDPSDAFSLRVDATTEPDDSCKTKRISACTSYLLPDLKSNMAIIEVNLISGYIPNKSDLKSIVGYGSGIFKRYEVDGNVVTIYVDELSPEEICISLRAIREVDVENAKPGYVKVYDYYKPEYSVTKKYALPPTTECSAEGALAFESEIVENVGDETTTGASDFNLGDAIDDFDAAIP